MIRVQYAEDYLRDNDTAGALIGWKESLLSLDQHLHIRSKNNYVVLIVMSIFALLFFFLSSPLAQGGVIVIILACTVLYYHNTMLARYANRITNAHSLTEQVAHSALYARKARKYAVGYLAPYLFIFLVGIWLLWFELDASSFHLVGMIGMGACYAIIYAEEHRKYEQLFDRFHSHLASARPLVGL